MSIIPYSSIFIDLSITDYFKFLSRFAKPHNRYDLLKMIEQVFIKNIEKERLVVTLSVRTAFDLFFQATEFQKGTEIIMTGINIPDMVQVVRCHGFVPVPVNIDVDKLAPKLEDIEKAITPKSKAIVVSYLYGARFVIDDIIKLAKKHNLYVIEDLAETFVSTDYNGHPDADLSLFSFGTIKYNTALAGAITVIRNSDVLYRKMKYILDQYPIQPTHTYFKKLFKIFIPMVGLNTTLINVLGKHIANTFNLDYKEWAISMLRGFSKDGDFLDKFRFQVCTPLLANLAIRMKTFDSKLFAERMQNIKVGQDMLLKGGINCPGHAADYRSFWLFPIIVPDVQMCYKMLNERGVDAYLGATQLRVVEPPHGTNYPDAEETREFFDQIIYLPIHKNVPPHAIETICKETIDVINKVKHIKKFATPQPKL